MVNPPTKPTKPPGSAGYGGQQPARVERAPGGRRRGRGAARVGECAAAGRARRAAPGGRTREGVSSRESLGSSGPLTRRTSQHQQFAHMVVPPLAPRVRAGIEPHTTHRYRSHARGHASRSTPIPSASKAPWAELVPLAWRVDPRLALALKERFPSLDAIGRALQALVMRHAAEPRVSAAAAGRRPLLTGAGCLLLLRLVGALSTRGGASNHHSMPLGNRVPTAACELRRPPARSSGSRPPRCCWRPRRRRRARRCCRCSPPGRPAARRRGCSCCAGRRPRSRRCGRMR